MKNIGLEPTLNRVVLCNEEENRTLSSVFLISLLIKISPFNRGDFYYSSLNSSIISCAFFTISSEPTNSGTRS